MPRVIVPGRRSLNALQFDTTSSRVNIDPSTRLDVSAFTYWMWVYITTLTASRRFWTKRKDTSATSRQWGWISDSGDVTAVRALGVRATTNWDFTTVGGVLSTSKWICLAFTYDDSDGGRLWTGDLATPPSEVSYSSRTVGAGAVDVGTGGIVIGNSAGNSVAVQGRMAGFRMAPKRMTGLEIIRQWRSSRPVVGLEIDMPLGMKAAMQVDYSGHSHHGAPNGVNLAQGPPLAWRREPRLWALPAPSVGFPWPRHPAQAQPLIRF